MSDPVQRFLAALREHGHEPRKAGAGWCCRCPAHDDRNPSLSIHAGDDGRALVNCHAGCTVDAVCGAVGLRLADLFPDDPSRRNGHAPKPRRRDDGDETKRKPARGGDSVAVASDTTGGRTFPPARDVVAELERRHGPPSTTWTYHNAGGDPVGLVIRWNIPADPTDPESKARKEVQPVSKLAHGWANKGMPTPRPLYGLPDLLATPAGSRVFIVEGEKAADAARAVGLVATTSPHGSQSASKADWSPVAGREVVILPDHDDAGERYADDVARLATAAGAKSVRVARLVELWAGMPEGGDMADLVEHRGGDVDPIRAEVEALADGTEPTTVDTPDLPAVPRFDLEAVIPSRAAYARDYLAALSRSTQTPMEMPALLGLAIASAAVCNVARVRGHGDHVEPAQLWGLVLCEPAVRKSAVLSELLAPIVAWEKRQADKLGPVIAAAVQRRKIEEKRLKAIEDNAARNADPQRTASLTDEAVRLAQVMQSEPIPTVPVLLASEPTPEALARQMVANHGRALLASAEADALDIVQGRYSGSRNYGILLKGHAGDAVRAQRVGRPGDTIDHPALAVALCVQPQAVRELWADPHAEGRGLLARFAAIMPPDRIGYRDVRPPPVPEPARARWRAAIDRLLTFDPSDKPLIVGLDADADAQYHDFQTRTESALGVGDLAERRAWGGKLCGLLLRIALTLHALETWALAGRPDDFPTIDKGTMRAAIAWANYLASAERHARELLGESDDDRKTRRLVEWIERRGGTTTVRDLTRGPREYRGDPERAAKALGELVEAGVGRWEVDDHAGGRGRPADRFGLLSRRGDAGDGDVNRGNAGNRGISVTVATVAKPTDAGDGGGEL